MAVKIRLARHGAKKAPYYRIVVADARSPRDGAYIDRVGTYNPRTNPSEIHVDTEKAKEWLAKGAQPTNQVRNLLKISGVL
jgi:small subunit ribosomal protein S16